MAPKTGLENQKSLKTTDFCQQLAAIAVYGYWLSFPWPWPWDFSLAILSMLALASATLLAPNFPSKSLLAASAPLLATGATLLISDQLDRGSQLAKSLWPSLLLYLMICGYLRRTHLIGLCRVWTLMMVILASWLLLVSLKHPAQDPSHWVKTARLTAFKVPNDVTLFSILMPVTATLVIFDRKPAFKWIAALGLILGLAVTITYQSRLAVLANLIGLGLVASRLMPHWKQSARYLGALVILILVLDGFVGFPLAQKLSHPWTSRLSLWLAAFCLFADSPVWGQGPGSFLNLYRDCLHTWEAAQLLSIDPRLTPWAHNLYLEILAEQGLVGLTAFLIPLALAFWMIVKSRLETTDKLTNSLATGFLASLIVFCLTGIFELSLWRQWVGPILFCLVAVSFKWAQLVRQDNNGMEENYAQKQT